MKKKELKIGNKTYTIGDVVKMYDGTDGVIIDIFEKYGVDYVEVEIKVTETIPAHEISLHN